MSQTSFRLPPDLLRALGRAAKQRGVPKSQLVREALERYLAETPHAEARPLSIRERSAPYIGSLSLRDASAEDIAIRIRQHNWRD